jgi:hypothetical protein
MFEEGGALIRICAMQRQFLEVVPGGKQLPGGGKDDNAYRVVISVSV